MAQTIYALLLEQCNAVLKQAQERIIFSTVWAQLILVIKCILWPSKFFGHTVPKLRRKLKKKKIKIKTGFLLYSDQDKTTGPKPAKISNSLQYKWLTARLTYKSSIKKLIRIILIGKTLKSKTCLWSGLLPLNWIEIHSYQCTWNFAVFFPSNLLFEKRLFFRFVLLKFPLHAERSCLLCFKVKLECP